jgi:hypothetical protein
MMRDLTYTATHAMCCRMILSMMKERGFVHIPIIDQDSGPSGVLDVHCS